MRQTSSLRFEVWSQLRPYLNFVFTKIFLPATKLRPVPSLSNVNKPFSCKYIQHFLKIKSFVCLICNKNYTIKIKNKIEIVSNVFYCIHRKHSTGCFRWILWFSVRYAAAVCREIFGVNALRGKQQQLGSPNLQDIFIGG